MQLILTLRTICEKTAGFKRLSPSVITPDELKVDFLLVSHDHPDHLDAEAVPVMMQEHCWWDRTVPYAIVLV